MLTADQPYNADGPTNLEHHKDSHRENPPTACAPGAIKTRRMASTTKQRGPPLLRSSGARASARGASLVACPNGARHGSRRAPPQPWGRWGGEREGGEGRPRGAESGRRQGGRGARGAVTQQGAGVPPSPAPQHRLEWRPGPLRARLQPRARGRRCPRRGRGASWGPAEVGQEQGPAAVPTSLGSGSPAARR